MNVSVLIVDIHADVYAKHLRAEFPTLQVIEARILSELPDDLSGVDVLIAFGTSINDEVLRRLKDVRWIQSLATGVDHFLRCPDLARHVLITSGRGIHGSMMREMAAFLMLSLSHNVVRQVEDQKTHHWERRLWTLLYEKTAVVVGLGVSGIAIGELMSALGMKVIGVTRTMREIAGFTSIMPTDRLIEAAAEADYLINVLPANPENIGLFNRDVFAAMKASAFFINIGRGETVDEAALIDCLRTKRIAGAALDVFRDAAVAALEPPVGHAQRGHYVAYRRIGRRIRALRDAHRHREHASFPGRSAQGHAQYRRAADIGELSACLREFATITPARRTGDAVRRAETMPCRRSSSKA
jgi:D-2-hydroxyacid dehydrogenase (NADP+)